MEKIKCAFIFEILGRPPEHIKESLEEFIDNISLSFYLFCFKSVIYWISKLNHTCFFNNFILFCFYYTISRNYIIFFIIFNFNLLFFLFIFFIISFFFFLSLILFFYFPIFFIIRFVSIISIKRITRKAGNFILRISYLHFYINFTINI